MPEETVAWFSSRNRPLPPSREQSYTVYEAYLFARCAITPMASKEINRSKPREWIYVPIFGVSHALLEEHT
jgi:hypothetical protein